MSTVINTNLAAVYARTNLSNSQNALSTSVERLSSGLRINRAKDDAAGLGISETIKSQLTSLNQSAKNANDAVSMLQTAEGSMSEVSDILLRMKELATQGMNESLSTVQKRAISNELVQLKNEINAIAERTTYNSQTLLKGGLKAGLASLLDSTALAAGSGAGSGAVRVQQGVDILTNLRVENLSVSDSTNAGTYSIFFGTGSTLKTTVASTVNARSDSDKNFDRTIAIAAGDVTANNRIVVRIDGKEYATQGTGTDTTTAAALRALITDAKDINNNSLFTVNATAGASIVIEGGAGTSNIELFVYEAAASKVTVFAESSTGLSSVAQTLDIGSIAAGTAREYNFDRLGINLTAKNTHATTAFSSAATNNTRSEIVVDAASTTAQFQVGAGTTRDVTTLDGFKDVRISEFNKNTDADEAMVFKRIGETIRNISVNSSASLTSDNFEVLQNQLADGITTISEFRANLGSQQNRLEYTVGNLQSQMDNLSAANSRIRDTDFAAETANLTKTQIMQQAATAMLAQANQMPNVILALLK